MKTKIIGSACLTAVGLIVAVMGYMRLQSMSGPARSIDSGTSETGMALVGAGACLALLGAILTVLSAIRSRT